MPMNETRAAEPSLSRLAILGASYRAAPTEVRARLQAAADDETLDGLLGGGYATGLVCIATCSRVEWLISADDPRWATQLLEARLRERSMLHRRFGAFALRYLFRVSAGLDSVVEGEAAVGRQTLDAFRAAHARGRLDPTLSLIWNALGRMTHDKRSLGPFVGLERAVAARARGRRRVAVFGRGDIGARVVATLSEEGCSVSAFRRAALPSFIADARVAELVVVASGAREPWLELPERQDGPMCIDLGSPPQVAHAPGWSVETLDELLASRLALEGSRRHRLEEIVEAQVIAAERAIAAAPRHEILATIDELRQAWRDSFEEVGAARALDAFAHELLVRTRRSS